jgi:Crp-like helix-turn-helix domain
MLRVGPSRTGGPLSELREQVERCRGLARGSIDPAVRESADARRGIRGTGSWKARRARLQAPTRTKEPAVCAHLHNVDQRCCRWLLMTRDRMPSGDFLLAHEFLGMMLGVRRTTVTDVMGGLQRAGLIHHRRGHVTILDHAHLHRRACECYDIYKRAFDRLLGDTPTAPRTGKKHRLISEVG